MVFQRAERYFIEANDYQAAIQMYLKANKFGEAYRV